MVDVQGELDRGAVFTICEDPGPVNDIRAPTVITDLAFCYQLLKKPHDFRGELRVVAGFVELVNIDVIGIQAAQAVFTILAQIIQYLLVVLENYLIFFVDNMPKFCGDDDLFPMPSSSLAEDFLAVTGTVIGCSIEESDPQVQSSLDSAD